MFFVISWIVLFFLMKGSTDPFCDAAVVISPLLCSRSTIHRHRRHEPRTTPRFTVNMSHIYSIYAWKHESIRSPVLHLKISYAWDFKKISLGQCNLPEVNVLHIYAHFSIFIMIFLSFWSLRVDSVYSVQGYDAILRWLRLVYRNSFRIIHVWGGKNVTFSKIPLKNAHVALLSLPQRSSWVHWVNADWRFSNAEPNFFLTFNDPRHRFHRMDSLWEINFFVE
jgi:hypothetical protein